MYARAQWLHADLEREQRQLALAPTMADLLRRVLQEDEQPTDQRALIVSKIRTVLAEFD